jgi:hypothetical protein
LGGRELRFSPVLLNALYDPFHYFGYPCGMPRTLTVEGLFVEDGNHGAVYTGIRLLGNAIPALTDAAYEEKIRTEGYPYRLPERIQLSGLDIASGKGWTVSQNPYLYRNVPIEEK